MFKAIARSLTLFLLWLNVLMWATALVVFPGKLWNHWVSWVLIGPVAFFTWPILKSVTLQTNRFYSWLYRRR